MRMRLLALVGTSLTLGAIIGACGGDDTKNTVVSPATYSNLGESCTRTGDCKSGLVCQANRCVAPVDGSVADSGGIIPSTGAGGSAVTPGVGGSVTPVGTGGTTPNTTGDAGPSEAGPSTGGAVGTGGSVVVVPDAAVVRLSGENESCTRTADCKDGFLCIAQTCMKSAPVAVDGGDASVVTLTPRLGGIGEVCSAITDCQTNLVCVPSTTSTLGTCQLTDYQDLEPSGKSCYECNTPEDCCELPLNLTVSYGTATSNNLNSCSELIVGINVARTVDPVTSEAAVSTYCASAASNDTLSKECFYYNIYCACKGSATATWACAAASHTCSYKAACTTAAGGEPAAGEVMGGCPTYTRAGNPATLASTCNIPETATDGKGTCTPKITGCNDSETADKCENLAVSDRPGETCSNGECQCVNNQCIRKCGRDLDCEAGFKCESDNASSNKNYCVPLPLCGRDSDCPKITGNVKSKCLNPGTAQAMCKDPCTTDRDCSPSGVATTAPADKFNGQVCKITDTTAKTGYCEPLGCSSNDQCSIKDARSGVTTLLRGACLTTLPSTSGAVTPHSAISW